MDVFEGCRGVREVTLLSPHLQGWGCDKLFPDAYGDIQRAVLAEGSTAVTEGLFRGCAKLEEVVLPESVTSIGADAFDGCDSLKAVKWPTGLREVDPNALRGSSIEEGPVVAGEQEEGVAE